MDFTFTDILKLIGSFIIAILIIAIPILCTLSFVLNWGFLITFILGIITVTLITVIALQIYGESEIRKMR